MADGWTTVADIPDGAMLEIKGGRHCYRRYVTMSGEVRCRDTGGDSHYYPPDTPARLLEPVAVAPGIDPTLRGLLLHALQTGETGALFDWLTEQGADPDLARAVRERCAAKADQFDAEMIELDEEGYDGLTEHERGQVDAAREIAAAIREDRMPVPCDEPDY